LEKVELTPLGRTRITNGLDQFTANEASDPGLDLRPFRLVDGDEAVQGERVAKDGRILEKGTLGRFEAVEPGSDDGLKRLRHRQASDITNQPIATVGLF
jgi:hypothetical protein